MSMAASRLITAVPSWYSKPLAFADTVTYRGMMFTGVPNMIWVFGYFRASWTLRADLIGDFACRLLGHM